MRDQTSLRLSPYEELDNNPLTRKILLGIGIPFIVGCILVVIYLIIKDCLRRRARSVAPLPQNLELAAINNP
jgi:hypothetical protein